jgi:hypothetical protein
MKLLRIVSFSIITMLVMGIMSLRAQSPIYEKENQEAKSTSDWFWDWLFNDNDPDQFANGDDFYNNISLKISLTKQWHFSIGDNPNWLSSSYDDRNWEKIEVPADWENDGFNGYDGYAIYRIHFDGRTLETGQTHFLILGFIDDVDETYLNGKLIGRSGRFPPRYRTAYNSYRKYHIPTEAINFDGDNVIAVRVYDEGLNGGIVSGQPGIYVTEGSESLLQDLYGEWKFITHHNGKYSLKDYDDESWENILVPSLWDNQGYRSFDGTAWYRKRFDLIFDLEEGKKYYLVLGKIDDFDITYLNGKEIGRTNDGKVYNESESYQVLRVYPIPDGILEITKDNVLAIKVHDFGGEGGIYKGPIGIVEESGLAKVLRNNY